MPDRLTRVKKAKIDENGQRSNFEIVDLEVNPEESAKAFSNEIFASVVNGVFDPPSNMTPRTFQPVAFYLTHNYTAQGALYAILPSTILGSYDVNIRTFLLTSPSTSQWMLKDKYTSTT